MSKLDVKILKGLNDLGYNGPLLDKSKLQVAAEVGQKSVEYTTLVNFLTNEIRTLLGTDEEVNAITSPEDSVAFVMEITSFLKELNCPYTLLTHGLVSERLQNVSDRLLLLDYLVTELMGARILQEKKPEKKIELKLQETSEGADMRQILQALRFPKPPANITIRQLFDKLDTTIPLVLNKAGVDLVGQGIFNGFLSQKQWETMNNVQNDLNNEYKIRREMLLTRLDVTIQSFQWSDRTKGKDDLFEKIYYDKRKQLKVDPDVDLSDVIAARTDLAIIEKTSSSSVRKNTRTKIHKVIIGQVPDRGGRSWEQAPPPPEMPSWQQRSSGPASGGRGGGRGGGPNHFSPNRSGGGGRGGGTFRNDNQSGYSGGNRKDYNQGGQGGQSFRDNQGGRGGSTYQNQSYDSSGSYTNRDNRGRSGYEEKSGGYRGGNDYGNKSYDSYGDRDSYSRGGNDSYSGRDSYNRGGNDSYGDRDSYSRGGDNSYGNYNRRDSGGSYGSQDYQQTKRPKTYDTFQANKTTYADQYVQDSQHNQQYHQRGRGGRGRSNYHRGGGGGGGNYR